MCSKAIGSNLGMEWMDRPDPFSRSIYIAVYYVIGDDFVYIGSKIKVDE